MKKTGRTAGRFPMRWSLKVYERNNLIKPYEIMNSSVDTKVKHNVPKPIPELGEGNPCAWL